MANFKLLSFCAILALTVYADDDKVPHGGITQFMPTLPSNGSTTEKPTEITHPPTTMPPKTTISTTTAKTTTTAAPPPDTTTSATTPKTTTSTATPNTTTSATTPKTTTTSSTTPATTTASTTTAKPTPVPAPTAGDWVVYFAGSNKSCIVLDVAIQIAIPYEVDNKTSSFLVDVPPTAKANGVCGGDIEAITLGWSAEPTGQNAVVFQFNKTSKDKTYDLQSVSVTLNVTLPGQGPQVLQLKHAKNEFSTPLSKSYKCAKAQTFNLTKFADNVTIATLEVSHLQVQAFRNETGKGFAEALDCAGSDSPDVVPIAVGCALAALVIVVLIAYLVGRRRSQARGYLSMFAENKREEDYIPMKNLSCFS